MNEPQYIPIESKPINKGQGAVVMLQGTASDVGKSIVTTALCRIFVQDGYRTAPYKSQNMALNSYVTLDGKEIGRAQGVQAEACGIAATTDMNPILIKPIKDMESQIVIHGVPELKMNAMDYRSQFLPKAKGIVLDALDRLRKHYDMVVIEGAGSPAEINLKDRDIVNMNLAGWADSPVILIADIDRGGVFASIVGTLELLEPHEKARIKGFIINKFRGDLALLKPGLDWLEERTGIPVLGVLPYIQDMRIEAEDSVVLDELQNLKQEKRDLDIVVIRYPRISNFTDVDALSWEPDVTVRFVHSVNELGTPDVIILPGTKDTISDLGFLQDQGLADAIREQMRQRDVQLVGICGGYQMLGEQLSDLHAVEGSAREVMGLGLLPTRTSFLEQKRTVRVRGKLHQDVPLLLNLPDTGADISITAYEIHMGVTEWSVLPDGSGYHSLFWIEAEGDDPEVIGMNEDIQAHLEGVGTSDGRIWGSYLHGLFDNDDFRRCWLNGLRAKKGLPPIPETFQAKERKVAEFDRIADVVRAHVDLEKVYDIIFGRTLRSDR